MNLTEAEFGSWRSLLAGIFDYRTGLAAAAAAVTMTTSPASK